jgi:hypothetical protein
MRDREPRRLGDLAEHGLLLGLDCRRCGHNGLLSPWHLFPRHSPATPWRWLRFRCEACGAADVLVRIGTGATLAERPPLLYEREDLLALLTEAIHTSLAADGKSLPMTRERARLAAAAVLRRLMAAGIGVSEPPLPGA